MAYSTALRSTCSSDNISLLVALAVFALAWCLTLDQLDYLAMKALIEFNLLIPPIDY
jgi:hypothetical protein